MFQPSWCSRDRMLGSQQLCYVWKKEIFKQEASMEVSKIFFLFFSEVISAAASLDIRRCLLRDPCEDSSDHRRKWTKKSSTWKRSKNLQNCAYKGEPKIFSAGREQNMFQKGFHPFSKNFLVVFYWAEVWKLAHTALLLCGVKEKKTLSSENADLQQDAH